MISRHSGDICFDDGLQISMHQTLEAAAATASVSACDSRSLPLNGWNHHLLGIHPCEHGLFEIAVVTDPDDRVQMVFLAHCHDFYEPDTPADSERRVFHEGVVELDLAGQREFGWGEALCRLDPEANRDWLIISYEHGPGGLLDPDDVLQHLADREMEQPRRIDPH